MRRSCLIFLLSFLVLIGFSQTIKTIIPSRPLVKGNSFRLQYLVSEPEVFTDFIPPSFEGFQLVSGPSITSGVSLIDGRMQAIKNVSFTILPLQEGRFTIGSIKGVKGNQFLSGDDIHIDVLPASGSGLSTVSMERYQQAEATGRSLEGSIFIRTELSRTSCYAGEPVVAEFTLFSGVESSAEADRSPAFYGFSVLDLVDFHQPHNSSELINGKLFNTSLLRKVLLFPVQSGALLIDPMYVHSQVIIADPLTGARSAVEKELVSREQTVNVKPLPPGKPLGFSGAVGSFSLSAQLEKNSFTLNEQGRLIVVLKGNGNFIQLDQPLVQWPDGIENAEPRIKDIILKSDTGLEGERIYEFSFTADSSGQFVLPPVSFSFFDPKEKKYQVLKTDPLLFEVLPASVVNRLRAQAGRSPWFIALAIMGLLFLLLPLYYFLLRKKTKRIPETVETERERLPEVFDPGYTDEQLLSMNSAEACSAIMKILRQFELHHGNEIKAEMKKEITSIREECQLMYYAGACDPGELKQVVERSFRLFR
jgi:hypothetical protein